MNSGLPTFFLKKRRWKSRGYPQVIHKLWITLKAVDSPVGGLWMFLGPLDVVGTMKNK